MTEENIELSTFFEESDWTPTSYQDWSDRIHTSREERERFDDLLKQLADNTGFPPAPETLQELGWNSSLGDIAGIGFGASTDSGVPGVDSEALAKALEAFGLAGLGTDAP